jgi:hypothetical protein
MAALIILLWSLLLCISSTSSFTKQSAIGNEQAPRRVHRATSVRHAEVHGTGNEAYQAPPRHDLWVAGAGTLGSTVLSRWKGSLSGTRRLVGETRTNSRMDDLLKMGVKHKLRSDRCDADIGSADNVLISFPPGPSLSDEEYLKEVTSACAVWRKSAANDNHGKLVLISSTAVYGSPGDVFVNEKSPVDVGGSSRVQTYAYLLHLCR